MANEIKMVGKLTVKNGGVNPKKIAVLDEKKTFLPLCKIFGLADGVKQKDDPISGKTFFPLIGRFQAVNCESGEITRSGVLYLPTGIHETYEAAVRKLEEGDTLQFAVELRAVRASNPVGYSYEAKDLMPPSSNDPLNNFAEEVTKGKLIAQTPAQKELPAPKPVEKKK